MGIQAWLLCTSYFFQWALPGIPPKVPWKEMVFKGQNLMDDFLLTTEPQYGLSQPHS